MSEGRQPSLRTESALVASSSSSHLRDDSSKSTPSTDASSTGQPLKTPATSQSPATHGPAQAYFSVSASPHPGSMPPSAGEPVSKQAKVAIPRLKRSLEAADASGKPGGRHRVTHACEPCRHRKTKCSGERPACRHCQDFKIQCYYADGKRDRVKKQFGTMQDKVAEYERILRDLSERVGPQDADLIRTTLERTAQLDMEDIATERSGATVPSAEPDLEADESGAESEASGGAGSTGALDRTEEDFTREAAKVTGFMGKNSDVTWLQRLRQENKYGDGTAAANDPNTARLHRIAGLSLKSHRARESPTNVALPEADQGFTIQESSYHLDDQAITTYEAVDAYELPTPDHAQKLFATYMHRVHPSFPLVGSVNLQNQFAKFIARPGMRAPPKWLAILNLIFAISAKYSHLVQAEWQADERDHLVFFTRARLLAIDGDTVLSHPDLQLIQIFGLVSTYLLCISQVNRAWNIAGVAIRMATGLGLNLRNDSADLPNELKEIRYRVWWSLYVLENRLCTLTGRVSGILDDHSTTPLPAPLLEAEFDTDTAKTMLESDSQAGPRAPSSNLHTPPVADSTPSSRSGSKADASRSPSMAQPAQSEMEWTKEVAPSAALYFLHLVQLARLTQNVFHQLYSPRAIEGKWSDIQALIGNLNQQLEHWYRRLPAAFDFRRKQRDKDFYEARLALGFYYYGTKMILHRPCLCRLDRKIPGQSEKSQAFNHAAATTCVVAAQEQLMLIPDEPNAVGLLRVGPWISIVHHLVQAATVLMLEISFRAHHMPEQADELLESSKKAVRWLHALGHESLAGARAWRLCHQMLQEAAVKIGRSVDDVPHLAPRAAGSVSDESSGSGATATQLPMYGHSHGPSAAYSAPSTMPMSTMGMSDMSRFNLPAMFDPLMHYDQIQYLPSSGNLDPSQMQYSQDASAMHFQPAPGDPEMNFMNQFTDQSQGQPGSGNPRSGFG